MRVNNSWVDKIIICFFCIIVLTMIDICIMAIFQSKYSFSILAGKTKYINGKLDQPVDEAILKSVRNDPIKEKELINDILTYEPKSPYYKLTFVEINGRLWRGLLETDAAAPEKEYIMVVHPKGASTNQKTPQYKILLFQDYQNYLKSFGSITKRFTGVDPWWVAIGSLPIAILILLYIYRRTEQEDTILQSLGIGPIYKLAKHNDSWEILFGLGSKHGVKEGDHLILIDSQKKPVREIIVDKVGDDTSHASVKIDTVISHDYFIAKQSSIIHDTLPPLSQMHSTN